MKSKATLLAILLSVSIYTYSQTTIMLDSTEVVVDTVYTGLDVPWEIKWGADGYIWTTERYGVVSRIDPVNGTKQVILDISDDVFQSQESGLLGMELITGFAGTQVYLVYTYLSGTIKERMVRYDFQNDTLVNPLVLIEDIRGNTTHDGSRLLILSDNTLLMTTGDAQVLSTPLDTTELTGKTLRFNLDGSVPADNPIPGSYVWSWGHRNAQGLVEGPNGRIYSSEHGPTTDDEFNILEKGKNYGWPEVHGFCDNPNEMVYCGANDVTEPLMAWSPTIAPSDIIWYDHPKIPEFQNTILMTVLKDKQVVRLEFNANGDQITNTTDFFTDEFGRLRDILQGPEGEIYIATNGASWGNSDPNTHSIIRLTSTRQIDTTTNDTTTSLNPLAVNDDWKIYPNPANDQLTIELGEVLAFGEVQIELYDISGKKVLEKRMDEAEKQETIDVSSLGAGNYLLQLTTARAHLSRKVLIQK